MRQIRDIILNKQTVVYLPADINDGNKDKGKRYGTLFNTGKRR